MDIRYQKSFPDSRPDGSALPTGMPKIRCFRVSSRYPPAVPQLIWWIMVNFSTYRTYLGAEWIIPTYFSGDISMVDTKKVWADWRIGCLTYLREDSNICIFDVPHMSPSWQGQLQSPQHKILGRVNYLGRFFSDSIGILDIKKVFPTADPTGLTYPLACSNYDTSEWYLVVPQLSPSWYDGLWSTSVPIEHILEPSELSQHIFFWWHIDGRHQKSLSRPADRLSHLPTGGFKY